MAVETEPASNPLQLAGGAVKATAFGVRVDFLQTDFDQRIAGIYEEPGIKSKDATQPLH